MYHTIPVVTKTRNGTRNGTEQGMERNKEWNGTFLYGMERDKECGMEQTWVGMQSRMCHFLCILTYDFHMGRVEPGGGGGGGGGGGTVILSSYVGSDPASGNELYKL